MNTNNNVNIADLSITESLFERSVGLDTPKKINRSTAKVDKSVLDAIEGGITSEVLNELTVPIFKYKTQITIHGEFDDLSNNYIGGYKMVFQNQNKSIGVKWNAIDFDKKHLIYSVMKHIGFGVNQSSSAFYAMKYLAYEQENIDALRSLYDKIDSSLFTGTKSLFRSVIPGIGVFVVLQVNINTIPASNVWKLITDSFDMTPTQWDDVLVERKRQRELEQEETRKRLALYDKEESDRLNEQIASLTRQYVNVSDISELPEQDCILLYPSSSATMYLIKKYTNKKGSVVYQVMRESSYEKGCDRNSINTRLSKYDRPVDKVRAIIKSKPTFLILIL